ncbi:hypothetical protein [Geopseudomonas aromaticivorans]
MQSISYLVLFWMFGKWAFEGDAGVPSAISTMAGDATPLTIFASYFTTVGLAFIGLLGMWTAFLGIFRLRQNGNFFGSQNSNEAFFYPVRLVAGLALCAPVIPIASAGGEQVVLTPGHALIVGIAKTASQWGDTAQGFSFRLMNRYQLFNNPDFLVEADQKKAYEQIKNWLETANMAAAYLVHKNPENHMASVDAGTFAAQLQQAQWKNSSKDSTYTATVDPFVEEILRTVTVPSIPPSGKATFNNARALVDIDAEANETVKNELSTENWACQSLGGEGMLASWPCSNEYEYVKTENTEQILEGIAAAQRDVWSDIMYVAVGMHKSIQAGDVTADQMKTLMNDNSAFATAIAKNYSDRVSSTVRTYIANDQHEKNKGIFRAMEQWGWMLGGAFALRSGHDFGVTQGFTEGAYNKLVPTSEFSDLTTGDELSKVSAALHYESINGEESELADSLVEMLGIKELLTESPAKMNIGNISAWGRSLAGTGIASLGVGWLGDKIGGENPSWKTNPVRWAFEKAGIVGYLVGGVMLLMGIMMGYVLPTVYAVFGVLGAISWVTFVASAFFGVNLWAAAQAAPKGEEHSSQMAAKGWNVMVFIGLYPILAVAGLAAAVTVTSVGIPLATFMMGGLWGAFDSGTSYDPLDMFGTLIVGSVVLLAVYAFLIWNICLTSAQLITNFPRTVLNMISFSEPGLNPYENVGQGVMSQLTGAVTNRHGLIGSGISSAASGVKRLFMGNGQPEGAPGSAKGG